MDISGIESWNLSDSDTSDVNVTDNVERYLLDNDQNNLYSEAECLISLSCVNLSHNNKTKCLTSRSYTHGNVTQRTNTTTKVDASDESLVCEDDDALIVELEDTNEDEWVVVNYDTSQCDPSSEWLIVSVNETCDDTLKTSRIKEAAHIDIHRKMHEENNAKRFTDSKSGTDDKVDLSEWAVLSMKITERRNVSNELEIKKEGVTSLHYSNGSPDLKEAYKHSAPVEFIQQTLEIIGQSSCEKTNVGSWPLKRHGKNNYKCAILCLLWE